MNSDDINSIANQTRSSIGWYCISECKSQCCKRGKLLLQNSKEITIVVGNKKREYIKEKILETSPAGNTTYNLEKMPCKNLKEDFTCSIHKRKNRPKVCQDYPLFILKNFIIADEKCPAVKNNLLQEGIEKLESLGLKRI